MVIALGIHATMRPTTVGCCLTRRLECCSQLISAVYHMNNGPITTYMIEGMHNAMVNRLPHSDGKNQDDKTSC